MGVKTHVEGKEFEAIYQLKSLKRHLQQDLGCGEFILRNGRHSWNKMCEGYRIGNPAQRKSKGRSISDTSRKEEIPVVLLLAPVQLKTLRVHKPTLVLVVRPS